MLAVHATTAPMLEDDGGVRARSTGKKWEPERRAAAALSVRQHRRIKLGKHAAGCVYAFVTF